VGHFRKLGKVEAKGAKRGEREVELKKKSDPEKTE